LEELGFINYAFGIGGLLLGSIFFGIAFNSYRKYRLVADTPTSKIRSAPQGYVEIKGTFETIDGSLNSKGPFSGEPCLWHYLELFESRDEDRTPIGGVPDPRPCLLTDETGACLVLASEADSLSNLPFEPYGSDTVEPLAPDSEQYNGALTAEEYRIHTGPGYALGRFMTPEIQKHVSQNRTAIGRITNYFDSWQSRFSGDNSQAHNQAPDALEQSDLSEDANHDKLAVASLLWARRRSGRNDIHSVILPTDEPRRPFIIGIGESQDVSKKYLTEAIIWSVGTLLFGIGAGSVVVFA
jgi:hypothetical protein